MTYTEEHFHKMKYDPVLTRCYYWQVAMKAKQRAKKERLSNTRDKLSLASIDEDFAQTILDNLDALVKASVEID